MRYFSSLVEHILLSMLTSLFILSSTICNGSGISALPDGVPHLFQVFKSHLVIWNCAPLLVGTEPKDTTKPKNREWKGFTCNNKGEHQGSFPKQCLPEQQNWGSFKPRVQTYSWRSLHSGEYAWNWANIILRWLSPCQSDKASKGQHHQFSGSS